MEAKQKFVLGKKLRLFFGGRGKGSLGDSEHLLLLQRIRVWFPASTTEGLQPQQLKLHGSQDPPLASSGTQTQATPPPHK